MGIDYTGFLLPKGTLRVEAKRERRLTHEDQERICRAEVWRLYGRKCVIPGCKERGEQHHLIKRSQSKRLKYEPTNRRPVCHPHHMLIEGGKITMSLAADGELIVTGERKYLEFKL